MFHRISSKQEKKKEKEKNDTSSNKNVGDPKKKKGKRKKIKQECTANGLKNEDMLYICFRCLGLYVCILSVTMIQA